MAVTMQDFLDYVQAEAPKVFQELFTIATKFVDKMQGTSDVLPPTAPLPNFANLDTPLSNVPVFVRPLDPVTKKKILNGFEKGIVYEEAGQWAMGFFTALSMTGTI